MGGRRSRGAAVWPSARLGRSLALPRRRWGFILLDALKLSYVQSVPRDKRGSLIKARVKIVIGVSIEGEGANAKLRLELDEVPVADLDELRLRLTDLSKKPGATKRLVVVAALKGTPFRWVRQITGMLSECGYGAIRFTEVDF